MLTRREFIQSLALCGAASGFAFSKAASAIANTGHHWSMPDENDVHERTWMAFGASKKIWGRQLLPQVQKNIATIALAIAKYEPVSMLVREPELKIAKNLMGSDIEFIACPLDDIWIRDTGPVFVVNEVGGTAGIDFNFNGWGEKQSFSHDAQVSSFVSSYIGMQRLQTSLVLEGGALEVDGQGTAIITESCVLNKNRNPNVNKAQCEYVLKRLLGLKKIIWLSGIKGKDITDGHTDFYARFVSPGTVVAAYEPDSQSFDHVVTKRHLEILRSATDARGRQLKVVVLEAPSRLRQTHINDDFAAGYINFYVCNGAVVAPEFGDQRADMVAQRELQRLFPQRDILQINIDAIAAGGGGIHCVTLQEPKGY